MKTAEETAKKTASESQKTEQEFRTKLHAAEDNFAKIHKWTRSTTTWQGSLKKEIDGRFAKMESNCHTYSDKTADKAAQAAVQTAIEKAVEKAEQAANIKRNALGLELRSSVKALKQEVHSLRQGTGRRIQGVESRIESRLEMIESRLSRLETRFDAIEGRDGNAVEGNKTQVEGEVPNPIIPAKGVNVKDEGKAQEAVGTANAATAVTVASAPNTDQMENDAFTGQMPSAAQTSHGSRRVDPMYLQPAELHRGKVQHGIEHAGNKRAGNECAANERDVHEQIKEYSARKDERDHIAIDEHQRTNEQNNATNGTDQSRRLGPFPVDVTGIPGGQAPSHPGPVGGGGGRRPNDIKTEL